MNSRATVNNVTLDSLHLFVPTFIPSPGQTSVFQRIYRKNFSLSFDSWTTDKKLNTTSENQLGIGSALKVISPKS